VGAGLSWICCCDLLMKMTRDWPDAVFGDWFGGLAGAGRTMTAPDFHERVLQGSQTATVVIDGAGIVQYASHAVDDVIGYLPEELVGHAMFEFMHPDDIEDTLAAFENIVGDTTRWPPSLMRVIGKSGVEVPVEVIGHGMFDDPVIEGAIYSIHRMDETMLLHRILEALATSQSLSSVLRLVTAMVEVPPLHIEVAVLHDLDDEGHFRAHASGIASDAMLAALDLPDPDLPWNALVLDGDGVDRTIVGLTLVPDLPPSVRDALVAEGYLECWVTSLMVDGRIVGALVTLSRQRTLPGRTVRMRMYRARDVSELAFIRRDHEEQLRHAAMHDRLTKIANRARFIDALEHGVGQQVGPLTGVLFLDLDGFKPLNDGYGHAFGDAVLVEVARRIDASVRTNELAARLGGDEFAVLIEGLRDAGDASALAERLCVALSEPMTINDVTASVSVSIGVAVGPSGQDRAVLLAAADQAMYEAKRAGKGTVRLAAL
jgi:diguanylate cyclase (GGDEF)-like protein/PAS domain S-box-containing protein